MVNEQATVSANDLRRIFGRVPSKDLETAIYRSESWHVVLNDNELHASATINECTCVVRAPAEVTNRFEFDVPAWLMSRVMARLGDGRATITKGLASILISSPSIQFRVLDVARRDTEALESLSPSQSSSFRTDGVALRRAVRIAGPIAARSSYFGIPIVQFEIVDPRTVRVSATDYQVLVDSFVQLEVVTAHCPKGPQHAGAAYRHLEYALGLIVTEGQPLDFSVSDGSILLASERGRVRIPTLPFRVPRLEQAIDARNEMSVSRIKLLTALEAVSALNESNVGVTLAISDNTLRLSGGSAKFGEVRAQIPVQAVGEVASFRPWRHFLEDWLRQVDADLVSADWSDSTNRWRWMAHDEGVTSELYMTNVRYFMN